MSREATKTALSGGRSALCTRAAIPTRVAVRVLAVATATCLALAGCSSTEPGATSSLTADVSAAGSGSLPDPCSLLTPADIADAAGVTMADGVINAELSNDTQSICEWKPEGGFPFVQVIVVGGADQVTTQRATAESMMGAGADVTVSGARDAYAVANGTILGMAVGDYFVQVSYMSTGAADASAITSLLAADAAAALS
jgi:hypothetical protein